MTEVPQQPAADPLTLAQKIHSFDESSSDPFALLSLAPGLAPVSLSTPIADLRSNYRKLASLIHPDRLKKIFEGATEAFQKLVRVFENVNDPAVRARLTAASAPSKKAAAGDKASKAKKAEPKKKEAKAKKPAPKRKSKAKRDEEGSADDEAYSTDSESDADSDDTTSSDESEAEATAKKATKSRAIAIADDHLGMLPREARDNSGCYRTPISCPGCNERWQPDDARHFTMLMAYGIRVFCNTCLLQFGPASAQHFCPHCKSPANYDISMFDKKVKCPVAKCGKIYGFSSSPVSEKMLEMAREKIREEAEAQRKKDERARRAAARSDPLPEGGKGSSGGPAASAELEDAIGQCMVTGSCPICEKNVRMKGARDHVTVCIANPPKKRKAACVIVGEATERKKAAAAAKKRKASAAKKSTGLSTKKVAPKKGSKRSRDSDSDSGYASSD